MKPVKFYFESSFFNYPDSPASFILTPAGVPNRLSRVFPSEPTLQSGLEHSARCPPGSQHIRGCHELFSTPSPPVWLWDALGNDSAQGWSLAPLEPAAPGRRAAARPQAQKGTPGPGGPTRNSSTVSGPHQQQLRQPPRCKSELHVKHAFRENWKSAHWKRSSILCLCSKTYVVSSQSFLKNNGHSVHFSEANSIKFYGF